MIQKPFTKPDRYICCPGCGKGEYGVSHLPLGTKTSWYCDECGVLFTLQVISPDEIDTEVTSKRQEKRLITLKSEGPVTLLVEGLAFIPGDSEEHQRYYYDEHTCPTNYMPNVVQVIDEAGDRDPHGVFRFISAEPWKDPDHAASWSISSWVSRIH